MSSDEDIDERLDDVCEGLDGVRLNTPPPRWYIVFANMPPIAITIVKLAREQECVGGHAIIGALFPTVVYTDFYCSGHLERHYDGTVSNFTFENDPTEHRRLDYFEEGVTLWPTATYTHVFCPLLFKDIEEFFRYTPLPSAT